MRGRKPKPTLKKLLAGNPGRHPLNDSEPAPDAVLPKAPADLTPIGKAKWDELAVKLFNQSILTELDTDMLYMLCKEWEIMIEAQRMVKKFGGPVVKTDKGNPIQNPYVSIANQAKERILKMLGEFGMSPSSRSRVATVKKAKRQSLAEKFFNAPVAARKI